MARHPSVFDLPENQVLLKENFFTRTAEELEAMFGVKYNAIKVNARNYFGYRKPRYTGKGEKRVKPDAEEYVNPVFMNSVIDFDIYAYRLGYAIDSKMW